MRSEGTVGFRTSTQPMQNSILAKNYLLKVEPNKARA